VTIRINEPVSRRPYRGGGFSLIELIVVMVIAAIMAAVAVPTLSSLASTRSAAAARLMVRDLSYARERAIASGLQTWVVFNVGGSSYSLLQEPAGNPGRANAVAINDPARAGAYTQTFGSGEFSGVSISSVAFDGNVVCGFDWLGKPLNSAQTALAANGVVTLTGGKTVIVQKGTGLITTP
jgi:prepilin-type N-terminal cleavage/methylation domain-containing protein